MTPLVSALISFITFIASIMQTTVSSSTFVPTSTNGEASGDAARKKVPTIGETISLVDALSAEAVAPGALAAADPVVDVTIGSSPKPFCSLRRKPFFSISKTERSFFFIKSMMALMSLRSTAQLSLSQKRDIYVKRFSQRGQVNEL